MMWDKVWRRVKAKTWIVLRWVYTRWLVSAQVNYIYPGWTRENPCSKLYHTLLWKPYSVKQLESNIGCAALLRNRLMLHLLENRKSYTPFYHGCAQHSSNWNEGTVRMNVVTTKLSVGILLFVSCRSSNATVTLSWLGCCDARDIRSTYSLQWRAEWNTGGRRKKKKKKRERREGSTKPRNEHVVFSEPTFYNQGSGDRSNGELSCPWHQDVKRLLPSAEIQIPQTHFGWLIHRLSHLALRCRVTLAFSESYR